MNDLEKYFTENTGRMIHKWNHYFEIYDRHFSRFRGLMFTLLKLVYFRAVLCRCGKNILDLIPKYLG